jgi:hypothetical protein
VHETTALERSTHDEAYSAQCAALPMSMASAVNRAAESGGAEAVATHDPGGKRACAQVVFCEMTHACLVAESEEEPRE